MPNIEYEADLTDIERAAQATAHKFAREVLRPAGIKLDAMADPKDVIAKDSILWEVFEKYRTLGLGDLRAPDPRLTPAQQARLRCIIGEELGWGDSGLSISFGVASFPRMMAQMSGRPELIDRFGADDCIGCWLGTEPDHGSDFMYYLKDRPVQAAGRPNCIARKEGDSFVINGQKSAWVSCGTIAKAGALFCAADMGDGKRANAAFLVPLDVPGVSKGKPLNKIGQRALNQGEVFFDHVRIPADYMVIPPDGYDFATEMILCNANGGMGTTFVGVAQAALDLAIDYAKHRVQGGVPIFQHQSVRLRLFEMFRKVQAARALNRQVTLYNSTNTPPKLELAVASKVTSTNTAFEVASSALQIFGGNGLSREYPIEKLMRDARASMIEDGCNDILSLVAAESL
ncbi:MAG TPA: acyl-CoA dehydrogenase family protein [Candidatus Binataceae bacterium]|nr:acyl-CoA dehydrogenase family protein [Candidatus Binataceae bacterium]